jgi:hypothetical protein
MHQYPQYLRVRKVRVKTSCSIAPLKVDAETDALITQGAHHLGITKKDLVAKAVRVYLAMQHTAIEQGVKKALAQLHGSREAEIALLAGLPRDEIDALGGLSR